MKEDSNQSAATPGTLLFSDTAACGTTSPSSPVLSLLMSNVPKPPELSYKQNADLPDVSAIAAFIDDLKQVAEQLFLIYFCLFAQQQCSRLAVDSLTLINWIGHICLFVFCWCCMFMS